MQPGDFFALLGPNGAGKSTLIGILSSLVNATGGEARIFGTSIRTDRSAAMRMIGLVPQELNFNQFEKPFDICVNQAGFYGIPRTIACERAEQYLKQLQIWDKAHQPARTMSGGMKRRLMIARAMMNEPQAADPRRADRRRRHRDPPHDVEIHQRDQPGRHDRDPDHALSRGSRAALPHDRDHRPRPHHREHDDEARCLSKLDVETFVLDLADSVSELPTVADVKLMLVDDHTIEAEMSREHDLNSLFAALTARGIAVRSMRNKANRLEELFVRLVESGKEAA